MMETVIFRNDDVSRLTNLDEFKQVDALFIEYKVDHHIALIAKDLEKHPELISYIKDNKHIKVHVHCNEHIHFIKEENTGKLKSDLLSAIKTIKEVFDQQPVYWFPPWNEINDKTLEIAKGVGLIPSFEKFSLDRFINNEGHMAGVLNFHSWHYPDCQRLDTALSLYTQNRKQHGKI